MERRVEPVTVYDGAEFVTGWRVEIRQGDGDRWRPEDANVFESEADAREALEKLSKKKARK